MRKIILFLALIPLTYSSKAQDNRLWATYYGGTGNEDEYNVTTDASGNVYLLGFTTSTTGIASNGFQNTFGGGNRDAFLVKFDAAGNRLWATYYGGMGDDCGMDIVTDASGNVYLAGLTSSMAGIASGGFQNSYSGGISDAFLVKFDPSGNRLWSTYYGGSNYDFGFGVDVDVIGNVYLSGSSKSSFGIASGGFQNNFGGGTSDAFLVKFNSAGNRLWATYYGGTTDDGGSSVATDISGNVYLAGYTWSSLGIASGGFQNNFGGGTSDAFLVKFNSAGNCLWATYYGGSGNDNGNSVITDTSGNVYLAGGTNSPSGIASGGFQNNLGGGPSDAFLVKFNSAGNRLWATYYGGTDDDCGYSVTSDIFGNVYLAGSTWSVSGIALSGFQNIYSGIPKDAFLVMFDTQGDRICATYYGGFGLDQDLGFTAVDQFGDVYLAGHTCYSSGIASGGFQNTFGGTDDAYLVKFTSCCTTPLATITGASTICPGQSATLTASQGGAYLWSNGATSNTVIVSPITTTSYSVIVTYICDSAVANATVVVIPGPTAAAWSDVTINQGQSANLSASGGGNYSWSDGQTGASITVSPTVTTIYCVTVSDTSSCKDIACVTVFVEPCKMPYLPNAFSPNNDGENDVLKVQYEDINCIKSFKLSIYNRWGEKVFEGTDPQVGWNGIYKGKPEESAVFTYYLKTTLLTNDEISRKGNISLVR